MYTIIGSAQDEVNGHEVEAACAPAAAEECATLHS